MNFKAFNTIIDVCWNKEELIEQIKQAPKPEKVGEVVLPADLNDLTFGQLIMLLSCSEEEAFIKCACELFKIENPEEQSAEQMWGFLMWVQTQAVEAAKLFNACHIEPTPEEVQAGANKMSFGWFGLIDWFALRMHITHEQAENTDWLVVLQSLRIDTEKQRYERRFRTLQERKMKAKKKR